MLLDTTQPDTRSEKEVRKQNRGASDRQPRSTAAFNASRFSVEYWRERIFRPSYGPCNAIKEATKEVLEWYAQIQFAGRRRKVGLVTNNKEEACRKAARFYATLRGRGWDEAHRELSPNRQAPPGSMVTVGDFIEAVRPLVNVRPRTFETYAYALRKIARDSFGKRDATPSKFNPKVKGWRQDSDRLPLIKLTPAAVAGWKKRVLVESEQNPVAIQRTRRNINSFARNARALFSKKILKKLAEQKVVLPVSLPFEGFEFEPQGSTKYDSKIDVQKILMKAGAELKEAKPEAWKVILLALGAGLRRSEIDALCWNQVDFGRCEIRVINHAFFQTKTEDSEGKIFVDPTLIAELQRFRGEDENNPVVNPEIPFRHKTSSALSYRCQTTFEIVTAWLRANGVTGDRPLHTLRKEFGSIICAAADIHTASRQLRHSNLSTTAAYYADNRRRVTVPVSIATNPAGERATNVTKN